MLNFSAHLSDLIWSLRIEFGLILIIFTLLIISTFDKVTPYYFSLAFIVAIATLLAGSFFGSQPSVVYGIFLDYNGAVSLKQLVLILFFFLGILNHFVIQSDKGILLLLLFSLLSIFILISSLDLFLLFLAIELLALSSCCLIAFPKTGTSLEASLKYFAVGVIGSTFLLFSVFVFYYLYESTFYYTCKESISTHMYAFKTSISIFTLFFCCAFFLKLGLAPFHYWVADVYEGAPALITVFLAVIVKFVIFVVLVQVACSPYTNISFNTYQPIFILGSGLSIIIGCFGALYQDTIKRLLAYSSINNAGFGVAGLAAGNTEGALSGICYIFFYCLAVFLIFIIILNCKLDKNTYAINYISDIKYLKANSNKFLASVMPIIFSLTLFSLAGIPPLTGFWTKFFVLSVLIEKGLYILAVVAALTSVVSSFYYINLIKILFFEDVTPKVTAYYHSPIVIPILIFFFFYQFLHFFSFQNRYIFILLN